VLDLVDETLAEYSNTLMFREATHGDFPSISRLVTSAEELLLAFPAAVFPLTVKKLRYIAEKRLDLTVASHGGNVIGFANLYDLTPGQRVFIGNVIVKKTCRGRGIGGDLLGYMLDRVFTVHDLPQARVSVFAHNETALSLYRRLGFRVFAEEQRETPSGRRLRLLHMLLNRD